MKKISKSLAAVVAFSIVMGFNESAVVIYLREIYYPGGFNFPLQPIEPLIAVTELCRELATLIMLAMTGYIAGKTRLQRYAYFALAFAVWDIFYYIFLYLFLAWPPSLFTWDILFLIPVPWVGPVWAPVLISLLMITGSVFVIIKTNLNPDYEIRSFHRVFLSAGALLCILSFIWDYLRYIAFQPALPGTHTDGLLHDMSAYIPTSFNLHLFFTGFTLLVIPVLEIVYNFKNKNHNH
jgi:hypothetical protein